MKTNKKLSELAIRIRESRIKVHLTQEDLGKQLGLSDKSISAYEQGRSIPPIRKLQELAKITSVPLSYFMEDTSGTYEALLQQFMAVEREFQELKKLLTLKSD
ncbi:helix-turn-helix transcriptional regulator [Candidatus Microgenomates bacterium]|nr:helix-turn-helix transcriptional regulator [Candidatus Microgenomates bacterium]